MHRGDSLMFFNVLQWCALLPSQRHNTRRVRDLWWQGVPPSVRGKVWSLAIGNELNITPGNYGNCCTPHIWLVLIICGHLPLYNINPTQTNTDCVQMNCVDKEAAFAFVTAMLCVLELYEIFLSRAKEKWRSFSETSSVNENEGLFVLQTKLHQRTK